MTIAREDIGAAPHPLLSVREAQTLRYIAEGCTCQQVAHRMGVTTHTVDTYLRRIKAKFGVGNKAELTRLAIALHL
jgi:DNA-binding CsgD family transcriptional regulator